MTVTYYSVLEFPFKNVSDVVPPLQFLFDEDHASQTYNPEFLDWDLTKSGPPLRNTSHLLSDRDHIATIFKGLLSAYDTFFIFTNTQIEGYTVGEIEALLLASESRVEKIDQEPELNANLAVSDADQQPKANVAYQNLFKASFPPRNPLQFGTYAPNFPNPRGSSPSRGAQYYYPNGFVLRGYHYQMPQYNSSQPP
uniref:Uncharacterized protein n=1 Tax=Cannabis sativa TaxID=3483 RepID=A0A803PBW5_CANSA